MLINNFSGGLSIKLSPHLINSNFSTICKNAFIEAGTIQPELGLLTTSFTIPLNESKFTRFNGQWISGDTASSFVEFNDKLYSIKGQGNLQVTSDGSTFYDVGITAPTNKLVATTSATEPIFTLSNNTTGSSDLVNGATYQYLVMYTTTLNKIKYKYLTFTYTGSQGVKLTISSMSNLKTVKLYRLYADKYKFVGSSTGELTILDLVLDKSSSASAGFVDDTLDVINYVYTYYSSVTGTESAPSPASDELAIIANNVTVTGFVNPNQPNIDTINLYRIGGTLTNYYKIASLSISTTSYTDIKTDVEALDGSLLETQNLAKPKQAMKFLTEYSSALFGCIDSTLYFSNPGLVSQWTEFNYIEFPEHITGLGSTQNGLLVFSRNKTWILVGTDSSNFGKYLLHGSQGCLTHNTISYLDNTLIWLSLDGICASTGGKVEIISEPLLGKINIEPIKSAIYENRYYVFHEDGCIIADFKNGLRFIETDIVIRGCYYSPDFDKLYVLTPNNTNLKEYGKGSPLSYVYKTGYLTEQTMTNYKTYKSLYIYVNGIVNLKIYGDGELISTNNLVSGFNEVNLPQGKSRLYYVELEFSGQGKVFELEFKVEGRQNGR